jgi:D,D-heptose 1,7-bisphosphate phosphatase
MISKDTNSTRAVFLDKDDTLIEDVPYNVDPEKIRLTPRAAEGLQLLHRLGYRLLIVSNQSGVARGYFAESALAAVEERLRDLFDQLRVPLDGFYYCPHHPEGAVPGYAVACSCRKPQPGLILRAAREHDIDLKQSWLIGDKLDDVEAGRRAGCSTVLLKRGHSSFPAEEKMNVPFLAEDLAEAARIIAAEGGHA